MSTHGTATNSTATAAPSAGVAAAAASIVSDEVLVYLVDAALAILVGIFALTRLPRALALFGSAKEWHSGHLLRRVETRMNYMSGGVYPPAFFSKDPSYGGKDFLVSDTHVPYTRNTPPQRLNDKGIPVPVNPPPHVASCPRFLRPFLTLLRMRVAPGFSVAQVVILAVYFFCVAYAGLYGSNVFTDGTRTGWVAMAQLPFVFVFAQKNNLMGTLLGYGYEKLNYLHRFAGRIVVLASNIHSLYWIYKWSINGVLAQKLQTPPAYWGLIGLICMDLLFFGSTEYWRKKAYNVFLATHIIGFSLVLPAMYMHKRTTMILMFISLGIYAFDHLLRIIKTRLATATIRQLPELGMTRVEIPSINAGWRAGQHVRLRVLTTAMGWKSCAEIHPFTIASVSKSAEGMVLLVKKAGGWTKKMYDAAKVDGGYVDGSVGREIKVLVEGPYGGPTHAIMSSFSGAVFVAGGSGITFALSAIQDIIQKDLAGESRVKVIELVWIITDPASLTPLLPLFSSLIRQSTFTPLRISVHYTRAQGGKQPSFLDSSASESKQSLDMPPMPRRPQALNVYASAAPDLPPNPAPHASVKRTATLNAWERLHGISKDDKPAPQGSTATTGFPPGLTLSAGRPRVLTFIEYALERVLALNQEDRYTRVYGAPPRLSGLLVGVCGPLAMTDDVVHAVGEIDAVRRDEVGGIEIVEEGFGW